MASRKVRLDKLILERGLADTRTKGRAMIMAGEVLVDGALSTKPGMPVPANAKIELVKGLPYVSRGGYKLAHALDVFKIVIEGKVCADVGACTGGFTDVLLQRGAMRVYAIDVGYGQLDWKLRNDNRVVVLERTNARYLDTLPDAVSFVSIDVSFISVKLILPRVKGWLSEFGDVVVLIKPQFEAGPQHVKRGGIVKDMDVHHNLLTDFVSWSVEKDLAVRHIINSPIKGAKGNIEYLAWLQLGLDRNVVDEEQITALFNPD